MEDTLGQITGQMMAHRQKIALPWNEDAEAIQRFQDRNKRVLKYWELSRAWNGRTIKCVTAIEALTTCNTIMKHTTLPKLLECTGILQSNIITHGSKATYERYLKRTGNQNTLPAETILL
jgi:hypothetical protein